MSIANTEAASILAARLAGNDWYIGLSSTTPALDGTNVTEPVAMNYSRVQYTGANWSAMVAGVATLTEQVDFPVPSGIWGTMTYFVIYDAASAGNLLYFGALDAATLMDTDDDIYFASDAIEFTVT